jgi:hypothetical protein
MRAVIPPDRGAYPYAGTGYANPDAVTQIANGLSTTSFQSDNDGNVIQKTTDGTTTTYVYDSLKHLTVGQKLARRDVGVSRTLDTQCRGSGLAYSAVSAAAAHLRRPGCHWRDDPLEVRVRAWIAVDRHMLGNIKLQPLDVAE